MNKSEIAERAAREIWCMQAGFPLGELPETLDRVELSEIELFKGVVERAIAESRSDKGEANMQTDHPIWQRGQACIGGKLVDKTCAEMSNQELADFVTEGAWRSDKSAPDQTAYQEAAKRLRELGDGEPSSAPPDKFKAALEMIENYDSSCECDDHTQPECCANVAVTDCFCAHCIAGKALL